jgi:hypothetical protein
LVVLVVLALAAEDYTRPILQSYSITIVPVSPKQDQKWLSI